MTSWYLWVRQSSQIWIKVELDADPSTRQGDPSDQQHNEHQIGEGRSEVDHLHRHTHMQFICLSKESPLAEAMAISQYSWGSTPDIQYTTHYINEH